MARKFRDENGPDQAMLMPADPRQWLPPGHLAWKVIELAGEMDLSRSGAACRAGGQGGRPYHRQMMAALLLLYCCCRGRRSSREIEMATFGDVGARVICGGLHPDHSTAAEFTRRNMDAVLALLPEPVKACAREGLVSLELAAGDGTKLKADAAMSASVTAAQLDAQISELEAVIGAGFRAWARDMLDGEQAVPAAPPGGGPGSGGGTGAAKPGKPERAAQTLGRRKAARAQLAARQDAEGRQEQGKLEARAAGLAARAAVKEAAVRKWEKAASDRLEARAAKIAAGQEIPGTRSITSIDEDREVSAPARAWTRPLRTARPPAARPPPRPRATRTRR